MFVTGPISKIVSTPLGKGVRVFVAVPELSPATGSGKCTEYISQIVSATKEKEHHTVHCSSRLSNNIRYILDHEGYRK